ncbi:MAG: guanylate kinase [Pirellulaceae bacterium]
MAISTATPAHLVVISGPSGAGKSTVVRQLLRDCKLPLVLSVSATTRAPRPEEQEGVHYYFLTPDEFARRRTGDEFLECKEVFGRGDWYGTLQTQVASGLAAGRWVLLEIDVEGTLAVLEKHPGVLTIFLHSGSLEEQERRLRQRNTETEAALQRRLEVARRELAYKDRYRYEVINRDVPQAVREICEILSRHAKE